MFLITVVALLISGAIDVLATPELRSAGGPSLVAADVHNEAVAETFTHVLSESLGEKRMVTRARQGNMAPMNEVKVYWHRYYSDQRRGNGYLNDFAINFQINALNRAFAHSRAPFHFRLVDIESIKDPAFFAKAVTDDLTEMEHKREHRKGTYSDLNIYTVNKIIVNGGESALAAIPPMKLNHNPHTLIRDGVTIRAALIPEGKHDAENFVWLTRAVAYWLGANPGQARCQRPDILLSAPRLPTNCLAPVTCHGRGVDPLTSYLDNVEPSCMARLRPSEVQMAVDGWNKYRRHY